MMEHENNIISNISGTSSRLVHRLIDLAKDSWNAQIIRCAQEYKGHLDANLSLLLRLELEQRAREVIVREALHRSLCLALPPKGACQQAYVNTLPESSPSCYCPGALLSDIRQLPMAQTRAALTMKEEPVNPLHTDSIVHRLQQEKSSDFVVHKNSASSRAKHPKKRIQENITLDRTKDERRKYKSETFVEKLFRMCTDQENMGKRDIVEFLEGGGGFWLHNEERLVSELLPLYLRGRSFSSFRRQLVSYGFTKETRAGVSCGAFVNPLFSRGKPEICRRILRDTRYDRCKKQEDQLAEMGGLE